MARFNLEAFNECELGASQSPAETHVPSVFLAGTAEQSDWPALMAGQLKADVIGPMAVSYAMESQQIDADHDKASMSCHVITPKQQGFVAFADMMVDAIRNPDRTVVTFLELDGGQQFNSDQKKVVDNMSETLIGSLGVKVFHTLEDSAKYINETLLARHGADLTGKGV